MGRTYRVLSDEQVEHFITRGHVVVHDCFDKQLAAEWVERAFVRLGYDPNDPATWEKGRIHMPRTLSVDCKGFSPKAWGAVCDLLGGEDRIQQPYTWGDSFIVNLKEGIDRPWGPPSAASPGWHKDGDFFRHFLDSPEQGLLTLVLWSDVQHQGGATFVAADSVGPVARFLADHPEGVHPDGFPWADLVGQCRDFAEATGEVGDVYLLHPFILHAKAQNTLRVPRFITNPPVHLIEPMRFDRTDPSLVEQAVLRGLGVDSYSFSATGPRERLVPERVARQQRLKEAEDARLAEARSRD